MPCRGDRYIAGLLTSTRKASRRALRSPVAPPFTSVLDASRHTRARGVGGWVNANRHSHIHHLHSSEIRNIRAGRPSPLYACSGSQEKMSIQCNLKRRVRKAPEMADTTLRGQDRTAPHIQRQGVMDGGTPPSERIGQCGVAPSAHYKAGQQRGTE